MVCIIIVLTPLILNTTLLNTLVFGVPHSIHFLIDAYYFWNSIGFHFIQFYIICKYFRQRVRRLNQILMEVIEKRQFLRIRRILHSFDSLYIEINEYNNIFWSKFLFVFWLTFGALVVWLVFTVVFLSYPLLIRIIFTYTSILLGAVYLFTILTAASINYSANNSYKALNSLFISYSKQNNHAHYHRVLMKFKV